MQEEEASGFVRVTVKGLIRGGAAERSGLIQPGDMVVKVDGHDVIGQALSMLRNLIPGPIGSTCHLGFLRGVDSNGEEKGTFYDVHLLRSVPDQQFETGSSMDSRSSFERQKQASRSNFPPSPSSSSSTSIGGRMNSPMSGRQSPAPARTPQKLHSQSPAPPIRHEGHRSFDMGAQVQFSSENEILRRKLAEMDEELGRAHASNRDLERKLQAAHERIEHLQRQLERFSDLQDRVDVLTAERDDIEQLLRRSEEFRREEETKRQMAEQR